MKKLNKKKENTQKMKKGVGQGNHTRDLNSKTIFHDPLLCCQFLKDNLNMELLKDIEPEDIEDITERFRTYMGTEFDADTVKKIWIRMDGTQMPMYMISLIEHKSRVDYNVAMQILRYMVCIWNDYEKEMNRQKEGISRNKSFRYPPILPIVYYEGAAKWTADLHLKDRIMMNEFFENLIPDFTYRLIRVHDYSNEELLSREDEMSLLMLINKVQKAEDFKEFLNLPREKVEQIITDAPERIIEIIASTIWALCMKMNVSEEEAKQCVDKVKERRMGYLFENMEKMDIQEERRKTAEAQQRLKRERQEKQIIQKKLDALQQENAEASVRTIISLCMEFGRTKEEAVQKLIDKASLNKEQAETAIKRYWKEK